MGDTDMSGAIVNGLTRQTVIHTGDRAIVHGEFEKLRDTPMRRERRKKPAKTPRWVRERKYTSKSHGRAYNAIIGVWGLLWYILYGVTAWKRGG